MDNSYPPHVRGGPFFGHEAYGGGGSSLQWAIFALQLLILAGLAVLVVRAFAGRPRFRRHGSPPAEEVLRHRYARGDISREQYLQASQDLGAAPEDAPTAEL